jgi:hypothetical protein
MANQSMTLPEESRADLVKYEGEMQTAGLSELARAELESSIIVAQRRPRNELQAFGRIETSCKRLGFALSARYSYPRGGQQIEGPSVRLAREMARCWGNIRYGLDIVHDGEDTRTVRGWAHDLETNTKETQDATFRKLIYRKNKGWVTPDERDLRERTNAVGAICVRNCLLHLMPPDLVDDAIRITKEVITKGVAEDIEGNRKSIVSAFRGIGVSVDDLEVYLGHPLRQASPSEVADLRSVWKSISDGNSVWSEYVADKTRESDKAGSDAAPTLEDLGAQTEPKKESAKKESESTSRVSSRCELYTEVMPTLSTTEEVRELQARADADEKLLPSDRTTISREAQARIREIEGAK